MLKAIDVFRRIETLPFARESSDLFDRPSINLGRIWGGDALNKVPDLCVIDVDVRYLPGQEPEEIKAAVNELADATVVKVFHRRPAIVARDNPSCRPSARRSRAWARRTATRSPWAATAPRTRSRSSRPACPRLSSAPPRRPPRARGMVSIRSLGEYRRALVEFVNLLPGQGKDERPLRIA